MPVRVEIDKDRRCVVIELPLNKPRASASGKTTVIATSHGLASGTATYSGRPVVVAASAFVYLDQPADTKERGTNGGIRTTSSSSLAKNERIRRKTVRNQPDSDLEITSAKGRNGLAGNGQGKRRRESENETSKQTRSKA